MPDKGAGGENVDSEILKREFVYLWYYFTVQLQQIFRYWVLGMMIGSAVSVFAKEHIHRTLYSMQKTGLGIAGIIAASALGIASPLCMYGTIPIAASFSKGGMKDDWLAAFMMSSILLNPQLIVYSAALGNVVLMVRIISCFVCGIAASGRTPYVIGGLNYARDPTGSSTKFCERIDGNHLCKIYRHQA